MVANRKLLRKAALVLALFTLAPATIFAADARAPILEPLPVRGEFLLSTGYLTLSPASTDVLADGEWVYELRVSSANTFALSEQISKALTSLRDPSPWQLDHLRAQAENIFVVDGETQRTTLAIRHGLSRAEIFASIPFISTGSTWSDGVIERFHSDFDLGSDGRSAVQRGRHFIYMKNGNREVIRSGEGQTGFGDLTLGAKFSLPSVRRTALAAEVLVELPTGDEEMLFGSGSVDAAINVLASRRSDRSSIFAAAGVTRLGTNTILGIPDRTVITTSVGYSRVIVAGTAATIQMTTANSPFKGQGWPELGKRFYQWSVGLQHQLDSRHVIHLALIENAVNYENSADFAVQIGVSAMR